MCSDICVVVKELTPRLIREACETVNYTSTNSDIKYISVKNTFISH